MNRKATRIIGGVGTLVLALAAGTGCTEKEPLYCDPQVNNLCLEFPGHYCNRDERRCKPK